MQLMHQSQDSKKRIFELQHPSIFVLLEVLTTAIKKMFKKYIMIFIWIFLCNLNIISNLYGLKAWLSKKTLSHNIRCISVGNHFIPCKESRIIQKEIKELLLQATMNFLKLIRYNWNINYSWHKEAYRGICDNCFPNYSSSRWETNK